MSHQATGGDDGSVVGSGWVFKHCAVSLHVCQQFARDLNKPPPACIAMPETPHRLTAEDTVVLSDCIAVWSWGVFTSPGRQCSDVLLSVYCLATDTFRSPLLQGHPVPFSFNWVVPSRIGLRSQWQVELLILVGMQISFLLLWHNTLNFFFILMKTWMSAFSFFISLSHSKVAIQTFLGLFKCISKGIKCDLCFRHKILITLYKR